LVSGDTGPKRRFSVRSTDRVKASEAPITIPSSRHFQQRALGVDAIGQHSYRIGAAARCAAAGKINPG